MEQQIDIIFTACINNDNRAQLFMQALNSFFSNTNLNLVSSVTLIDDCSDFDISVQTPDIKYFRNDIQRGAGWSRNLGINNSNAPIIYLSDTDVFFTEGWLDKLYLAYLSVTKDTSKIKLALLAGGAHPYSGTNAKIWYKSGIGYATEDLIEIHTKDAVSTWSWMFSRELYDQIGKIADNSIGGNASEDVDWCTRLHAAGYEVGSLWPEVVQHCGITSYDGKLSPGAELFPRISGVLYL